MAAKSRGIWNGAISFGLVNIPVELHSATKESGLDFDWIDKRTLDRVGYKRINKRTGEDITTENIVKGIEYEKDQYVILSDDEIHQALVKSTQTIELVSFVSSEEIPLVYFDRPYYLVPSGSGKKAYILFRETLKNTKRAGIGLVVIHNKQHAAAIIPEGNALILILLRWEHQIRSLSELELPTTDAATVTEGEISMAEQLVASMTNPWDPDALKDSFTDKVMALVDEKVKTGQISSISEFEEVPASAAFEEVIDFTELLKKSLQRKNTVEKHKKKA